MEGRMAKTLTAISARNARPGTARREIPDGGCRGLYLVIQPSGAKSWACRFRYRGVPRKLTLGQFLDNGGQEPGTIPQIGMPLSLASARELATKALRGVAAGGDPPGEERKQHFAQPAPESGTPPTHGEKYFRRGSPEARPAAQRSPG